MENSEIDLYLVPIDFTPVTEEAMDYALELARTGGGKVLLAHIVKSKDQVTLAEKKLDDLLKSKSEEDQKITEAKVMVGDIFKELDTLGDLTDASAIVMGTHGANRFQKFFGSNALKVVSSSSIPFFIVQEGQKKDKIDSIVMPFSFARESVQVTQFAASLAEKYDATIHLVGYRDKDEWLLRDMKTNQAIVRKHLTQNKIKHDLITLPGKKSYEEELMEYAEEANADLIAAAYFSTGVKSLFHSFLQAMIMNENKIPVITVNAPEVMAITSGGYSFLSV
jgi:nucleotide-binding universal stress UspA family protein